MDIVRALQGSVLIGDGAMGTQLYRLGVPVGVCYQELNVTRPEIVAAVHSSYYEAGARVIGTNTFGAHRASLERYGLEDQLQTINREAVRVARKSVGVDAYVVGTIGSIAGVRHPSALPFDLLQAYAEQASALLEEDIDGVLLETFLDVEELLLAVQTIRKLTDQPIIAQLALIELTVTRDGVAVGEAFRRLLAEGASVVGLNCRFGPADIGNAYKKAELLPDMLLSAYPNAGLLSMMDGQYDYPSEPAYFGAAAKEFHSLGIRLIGGCCGTTPEHVRAMAQAVAGLRPVAPGMDRQTDPAAAIVVREPMEKEQRKSSIHEKVLEQHTVIVELDPPKELSAAKFLEGAKALQRAGADAVTLADNSLAVMRMSNMALGALMKRDGIEPLLHISCRDRNLIGQQSHLMGLHALGINQVLVITGDPSRFGDFPGATSVFDVSSFDMIRMVKQLNQGIAFSGRALAERSAFVVGAAFNPHVRHLDKAIKRLERKVEAGADFIMTQPIYDPHLFEVLRQATIHIPVPLFVGVMPLMSARNAEFLHNEVPGISLTEKTRQRMSQFQGAEARAEGLAIARELLDAAMAQFHGIYLITPMLRYEMTVELTQYVRDHAGKYHPLG